MTHQLSKRAEKILAEPPMVEYIQRHFELSENSWSESNPDGYVGMCVAENKLVWDLLEPRMAECRDLEHFSIGYNSMIGSIEFRQELAGFMGRTFLGREVDPESLAVVNGAGSAISRLVLAAKRLISNSTSSCRLGLRCLSKRSTTASVETVASTVDFNTSVGGKTGFASVRARAAIRWATERVKL